MGFRTVASIEEAVTALAELGSEARVIAGGTDVMIQRMTRQLPRTETLVHIGRVDELRGVSHRDGLIRIGALTTHREIRSSDIVVDMFPALARAAATVGGWQTQEAGTIGGNLCNASPAADLGAPVLMADAEMVAAGPGGERRIAAADFFQGRRRTALQPGELLVAIEVPEPPGGSWETYLKVGRRSAMEVAIVGLAARVLVVDGVVTEARIALCAVAPRPVRALTAEAAIVGTSLDGDAVAAAGAAARDEVEPIDDHRATAGYRSTVVGRLVRQALESCRAEVM